MNHPSCPECGLHQLKDASDWVTGSLAEWERFQGCPRCGYVGELTVMSGTKSLATWKAWDRRGSPRHYSTTDYRRQP